MFRQLESIEEIESVEEKQSGSGGMRYRRRQQQSMSLPFPRVDNAQLDENARVDEQEQEDATSRAPDDYALVLASADTTKSRQAIMADFQRRTRAAVLCPYSSVTTGQKNFCYACEELGSSPEVRCELDMIHQAMKQCYDAKRPVSISQCVHTVFYFYMTKIFARTQKIWTIEQIFKHMTIHSKDPGIILAYQCELFSQALNMETMRMVKESGQTNDRAIRNIKDLSKELRLASAALEDRRSGSSGSLTKSKTKG
jgi:hypothetical protein